MTLESTRLAILAAFLTIVASLLSIYSFWGEDEQPSQTYIDQSTTTVIDNTGKSPTPKNSDLENGNQTLDNNATSTPKEEVKQPEKVTSFSQFYNTSFFGDIVILNLGNEVSGNIGIVLQDHFSKKYSLSTSSSFFKSTFLERHDFSNVSNGISILDELNVSKHAKCVCSIFQSITYEEKERSGLSFFTARGSINLKLYDLRTKQTTIQTIRTQGAGVDKASALAGLEENFEALFPKENKLNFLICND